MPSSTSLSTEQSRRVPPESTPPASNSREERVLFWGNLVLAGCVATYLAYVYASSGAAGMAELATAAGLSFAVLGKLVIFWGLKHGAAPVWSLAVMTFLIDL